jgi:trk system potassium uptake protein
MLNKLPYKWKRRLVRCLRYSTASYRNIVLKVRYFQDDIYEFNRKATPWLKAFSIVLSILVFISLLMPLVFTEHEKYIYFTRKVDQILLIGFGCFFYTKFFLAVNYTKFLLFRWPEGIAASLALLFGIDLTLNEGIYFISFLNKLGISGAGDTLLVSIQIYLILLVFIKIIQETPTILSKNRNPAQLVLLSFFSIIVVGMLLLMLPSATTDTGGLSFIDALFMATSSVCVTGLIVVDTATHLTLFGQGIILLLIQIGGIGIVTFATFLAMYISGDLGFSERYVLKETISGEEVDTVSKTMKKIVLLTFVIEFFGFISFYLAWSERIPDTRERIWYAIFHSVSAFCNAGFSIFTHSLADPVNATSLTINITTMALIILGGLGFTPVWEFARNIFSQKTNKRYSIHTIIVFRMTVILISFGTLAFLFTEWSGVLHSFSFWEKILLSAFQSVTTRTAGFNTVDIGELSAGTTLIIIVLMTIGGSPSSTAGGLKTTTIYILFKSMMSNIRGMDRIEIAHRTVPNTVIFRSITAVFLAVVMMTIGLILLTIVENFSFLDILFEQVSAFMTVGLSRGITGNLSDIGKFIIIFSMFAGRVGMLTLAVAFAQKKISRNYKLPEEYVMVA